MVSLISRASCPLVLMPLLCQPADWGSMTTRIAMWSGPRNLSTAMMRSFENRADCTVVDEPLYAAHLADTGLAHPGRDDVRAAQPTDWRVVLEELASGPVPTPLQYQKHMTHHL